MDGSLSDFVEAVKKLQLQIHHHCTKGREGIHRRIHYLVKMKLAHIITSRPPSHQPTVSQWCSSQLDQKYQEQDSQNQQKMPTTVGSFHTNLSR
eukprot:7931279-Ditylum_brightwellii.AAC.1